MSLSIPELWSKFRLSVPDNPKNAQTGLIPLQLHLERSRNFPLTLILIYEASIFFDDDVDNFAPDYASHLDLLFSHAHHWRDAYMLLSPSVQSVLFNLLEGIKGFPMLHTLRTVNYDFRYRTSLLQSPNLRHLEFISAEVLPFRMKIPWSQILSISISRGNTDVLGVLSRGTVTAASDAQYLHLGARVVE